MELRQVKKQTTWNDAANVINTNTQTIAQKIAAMEAGRGTIKGYFASLDALQSAYPVASIGDTAYVGASYPYAVYKYTESGWVNTGATGGESIDAYTKEESDSKFLSKSGGEITGDLKIGVVTVSKDSNGYVAIDSDRNDPDAQLDIYAGGGIHLRSNTTVHGALSASQITENGKRLSDKYATKEEAYDFVNVGEKDGLSNAIASIPSSYRMSGQVVTFVDTSKISLSKQTLQIYRVDIVNVGSYVEMFVKIGDRESDTFIPSANAISPEDGTVDYNVLNRELYDFIRASDDLRDLIQSSDYSSITGVGMGIYTLTAAAKDAKLSIQVDSNATIQYDVVPLANYAEGEATSYQYMALSTSESSYLDTINWTKYKGEGAITWKGF